MARINEDYQKLQAGYLFPEIGRRVAEFQDANPGAALIRYGGSITHHHAVGRDHRPWYDAQRPDLFAASLRAAKAALDPAGVMNPGVLIDPL